MISTKSKNKKPNFYFFNLGLGFCSAVFLYDFTDIITEYILNLLLFFEAVQAILCFQMSD